MRLLTVLALLAAAGAASAGTATYSLRFDTTWTAETHPQDYPSLPHFSGLVGGTHDGTVAFWAAGEPASLGIQRMAEWGSQAELLAEVEAAILDGSAEHTLSASPLWTVPGSVTMDVTVSDTHPLVTVVSMVAPSPDWFVGVAGLDLRDGGGWADEIVVELFVWDAGTDSGPTYESPDQPTTPPAPIFHKNDAPLTPDVPFGTFTFTLQAVSNVPATPAADLRVAPNPFNPRTVIAWRGVGAGEVAVEIFDLRGWRVRRFDRAGGDGQVAWDGRDDRGRPLPNATYLVRVAGPAAELRRKVTLIE